VVLACSLLQLCRGAWGAAALKKGNEGAWLHRNWIEHGVCFLPVRDDKLDLACPYLPITTEAPTGDTRFDYHGSSVVALAITLVQLQDDEVIEELDSIREYMLKGGMTPNTNYCALLELVDTDIFRDHVDDPYQRAIRACLAGDFANSIDMEKEEDVQNYFTSLVLSPLVQYHCYLEKLAAGGSPKRTPRSATNQTRGENKRMLTDTDEQSEPDARTAAGYTPEDGNSQATGHQPLVQQAGFQTGGNVSATDWVDGLRGLSDTIRDDIPPGIHIEPIRVAIIDTGVNLEKRFFVGAARRAKIRGLADFVPGSKSLETTTDTFGHGSLMAQLLMEAAPLADVYIARAAEDTASLAGSRQAKVEVISHTPVWQNSTPQPKNN